jgi:hypothetical protein
MDKETRVNLLRQFSLILKTRSKDEKYQKLTPSLGQYYARKDLIEILKKKHGDTLPPDLNLMECENKELLTLIGDDMYLISYSTENWTKETLETNSVSITAEPPKLDIQLPEKKEIKDEQKQTPILNQKPIIPAKKDGK